VILDTRTLLDYFDASSPRRWTAAGLIENAGTYEELVVSPFVIAELERLVRERFGGEGWLLALEQLASGAWTIASVDAEHLEAVRARVAAGATLAGASVAVLVEADS
jgi:predicted nucleic acid-binding protein